MTCRLIAVVAMCVAVGLVPSVESPATASPRSDASAQRQGPTELVRQNAVLKRRSATLRRRLSASKRATTRLAAERDAALEADRQARRLIAGHNLTITVLTGQVRELSDQRGALAGDNARLREGLPNAIGAVPADDLFRLVLSPARAVWPCDSYYTSGDYFSLEFYSRSYC